MSTFQYIILGLGGILVASGFINKSMINAVLSKFKSQPKPIQPNVDDVTIPENPVVYVEPEKLRVSQLVSKWEILREDCEEANMKGAVKELDDVFANFLELVQKKPTNNNDQQRRG